MELKRLHKEDAQAYRKLRLEALFHSPAAFGSSYEEEREFPLETTEIRLADNGRITLGAFTADGQLAGSVTLIPEQRLKLRHRATLVGMYVHLDCRRTGVGRRLMETAISQARELPFIEQLCLSVMAGNEAAKSLYVSLGFETLASIPNRSKSARSMG